MLRNTQIDFRRNNGAQQGARANDHGCHDPCSEQHGSRQPRSWLILNVRQKFPPMKSTFYSRDMLSNLPGDTDEAVVALADEFAKFWAQHEKDGAYAPDFLEIV